MIELLRLVKGVPYLPVPKDGKGPYGKWMLKVEDGIDQEDFNCDAANPGLPFSNVNVTGANDES
ncbi:MAG: hypothetical protein NT131_01820 [Methanomassiliicoccales archaeon]|nr:hypothetical protein [Methanomassiliicoccales archaeon]